MKKTVIVLGTWSSGSGAISDYLSSRADFINPFGTNEFKLISDPMGLHHLYTNCYTKKDLLYPSLAFENFKYYVDKLKDHIVYSSPGVKKKLYDDHLIRETKNFLKKITFMSYYGFPHFKDVTLNLEKKIQFKLKRKLLKKNFVDQKLFKIIVPVEQKVFLKEAKKYIDNVINHKDKFSKKNIVLNNGGDILDPVNSTNYYNNSKIICVTRDPRDIFCGMKTRQANSTPWYDVNLFIKWYKFYFASKKFKSILNHPKILVIKFENFVNDFEKQNKRLCKFLRIKEKTLLINKFDINSSKKNIHKSKKYLNKKEQDLIKKKLKKYLQW